MFGYVRTDTPYLYIKDETLYKAMYCGVCKGIGEVCGHRARMGLSYDVAFLSVILHNIAGQDVKIERAHCLTHLLRAKKMANVDEMTRRLGAFNTELTYFKFIDDVQDGDKGKGKRLWFLKGHKRVLKKYPKIAEIVAKNMSEHDRFEKSGIDSIDRAADATANMLAEFSDYVLEEKRTNYTHGLFYALGKWIYLIDALDDYDKDVKKSAYNPFKIAFDAACKGELMEKCGEEVRFVFQSVFSCIKENLEGVCFRFNRDLSDNILLRGLPKTTAEIMNPSACKRCKKTKEKKNGKAV